ncbi:hypothetical protein H1N95_gp65 [Escherichia phage aalborv]|jgi:hypothetical protein|uniref:Uncharacterized protein n=4 Tax=Hanrivervirus TaxID=2560145 RepID=A0A6B9X049_9CAUD|nr:hypothetical protein H1N94_gp62 [Escherichia phage haarsle]YP_009902171.1 hypothetical protein H1N95_gp65 [Escherichia phage aalborv]QXV82304.1 hypothetical protein bas06_0051 [Escherichia phage KarlJaspers]UGL62534.1 putative unimolecular spanin [Escherichia phage JLBYU09]QHR68468.1 hypothetical protein aalborv_65 [Escherichia phage aalborv]QHR69658.1 hypothetical protein haarsle_62 [Escherichia phage haarsle]
MKNCLRQMLIDKILKFCAVSSISHDDFMHAMLTLIHSDMRAFDISEHNLCDEDGVLLVTVKRIE